MLFIAAVFALLGITSGCSCMGGHPQRDFCSADFTIKGVVKDITTDGGDRFTAHKVYTVLVDEIFKGENVLNTTAGSEVVIKTPVSGALCGVHLHKDSTYLLLGSAKENGLFIHLCNGNNLFEKVTDAQLVGLQEGYDCSCNIIMYGEFEGGEDRCYGPEVLRPANTDECDSDYEMCAKVDDECKWTCSED